MKQVAEYMRIYQQRPKQKKYHKSYAKRYYKKNKDKILQQQKDFIKKNPDAPRKWRVKWFVKKHQRLKDKLSRRCIAGDHKGCNGYRYGAHHRLLKCRCRHHSGMYDVVIGVGLVKKS